MSSFFSGRRRNEEELPRKASSLSTVGAIIWPSLARPSHCLKLRCQPGMVRRENGAVALPQPKKRHGLLTASEGRRFGRGPLV